MEVNRKRIRVANQVCPRKLVFGAQDEILNTVALVTPVAVAFGDGATVMVAGISAALPETISVATGANLESRAEQDVQHSELARELEERPEEQLAEPVIVLQQKGRSLTEANDLDGEAAENKETWLGAWWRNSWAWAPRRPPTLSWMPW